jgi:hypothetical protein
MGHLYRKEIIWYNNLLNNAFSFCETVGDHMYHISNDQRSKNSAEYIYEALSILLKEKNQKDITISKLVIKAGVGRTTFYRCFDSIHDILQYKSDLLFYDCAVFIHQTVVVEQNYNPKHTFIIPFLDFWHPHADFIETLLKIDDLSILYKSFKIMIQHLEGLNPNIPIEHYDYFVEVRAAVAISILVQWIRDKKKYHLLNCLEFLEIKFY